MTYLQIAEIFFAAQVLIVIAWALLVNKSYGNFGVTDFVMLALVFACQGGLFYSYYGHFLAEMWKQAVTAKDIVTVAIWFFGLPAAQRVLIIDLGRVLADARVRYDDYLCEKRKQEKQELRQIIALQDLGISERKLHDFKPWIELSDWDKNFLTEALQKYKVAGDWKRAELLCDLGKSLRVNLTKTERLMNEAIMDEPIDAELFYAKITGRYIS